MARPTLSFALAAALALALAASPAAADVAPNSAAPPDDCTTDKQCKDGATCPTLGGEIDKDCAKDMADKGFVLKCQQQKATVARAVYCPAAKKGCGKSSVAPASAEPFAWGLAVSALAAAAALRRARSRRSPTR